MTLYKQNLIEGKTITASSFQSGSDVDKLYLRQIGSPFLFGTTGGNIVVDMGTATVVNNIFMGGINGSWTVQANATNVWTTPSYSVGIIKDGTTGYIAPNQTYRYWRFVTTTDIGVGLLTMTNTKLQLPGIDQGSEIYYYTSSQRTKGLGGQAFADEGYQFIETNFSFPQIGETQSVINGVTCCTRKDIISFWQEVQNIIPIWCIIWEQSVDEFKPFLCVIKEDSIRFKKNDYPGFYSLSISLEEVL